MPSAADIRALADGEGRLAVRATPNASGEAILLPTVPGATDLLVRTTATPEGGKANEAILRLLADALGQPVSAHELLRGGSGRTKLVRIGRGRGDCAMLIRQGDDRDSQLDRKLAFALAAIAGGLNAAAFHEVGFFSANMTGNVSALSSLLALGQWAHGLGYLAIVLAFIIGAMASTLAISAGLRRGIVTIYARVILAEAACLILLGLGRMALDRAAGVPLLILGLAFLMGLQNAIVTHISNARVRTTHVSGMSTDIGIGLARMVDIIRCKADATDREAVMLKLRLHAGTVMSFLLGGVAGVVAWRAIGDLSFTVAGLLLAVTAAISIGGTLHAEKID